MPGLKSDSAKVFSAMAALVLLPLAIYALWAGWQSWQDGSNFRHAPAYDAGERINGRFYRHQGVPRLTLTQPEAFSEIAASTQYKAERQNLIGGNWITEEKPILAKKQKVVVVASPVQGEAKIEPNSHTLYSWPLVTLEKALAVPDQRYLIRYRPILPEGSKEWVVYGTYRQGRLQDSDWHRLTVTVPESEESVLKLIEQTGQKKALIHLLIAILLSGISYFALRGIVATRPNVERIG